MTLTAFQKSRIIVMGGGLQWRPLVNLSDVSNAFINVLGQDFKKMNGEVFHIGLDNFQIKNLAYLVREQVPYPIEIDMAPDDAYKKDHHVVYRKAEENIGFKVQDDIVTGIP